MNKKAGICYLQIFILILAMFAFSYLIYSVESVDAQVSVDDIESALSDYACCEETDESAGALSCQYIPSDECNSRKVQSQCELTSFCRLGCCYSSKYGICSANTPKATCENDNGLWIDSPDCNDEKCYMGCCVLGSNAGLKTEKNCYFESKDLGEEITMEFHPEITSEAECIYLSEKDAEGACVYDAEYDEKGCEYMTRGECFAKTGDRQSFYESIEDEPIYCSNMVLAQEYGLDEPICGSKHHTGCHPDMFEKSRFSVYWFDSCNNPEEIFGDACDVLLTSSICSEWRSDDLDGAKKKDRDDNNQQIESPYTCKSLSCKVQERISGSDGIHGELSGKFVDRRNGEAWCEYIGEVDDIPETSDFSGDVVGSEHILHQCVNGQEVVKPCDAYYRNEICVQQDTKDASGNIIYRNADCVTNSWRYCFGYNELITADDDGNPVYDEMFEGCGENPFCRIHNVSIDDYFSFSSCVPRHPPAFDINSDDALKNGEGVCSFGTQTCTVYYQKKWKDVNEFHWVCVENCKCESTYSSGESEGDPSGGKRFTQEMNKLCRSLGDCGGYVNIAGVATEDGYTISASDGANVASDLDKPGDYLLNNANFIEGQKISPPDMRFLRGGDVGEGGDIGRSPSEDAFLDDEILKLGPLGQASLGLGIGGAAFVAQVISWGAATSAFGGSALEAAGAYGFAVYSPAGTASPYIAGMVNAIAVVGAAIVISVIVSKLMGFRGQAPATMMAIMVTTAVAYSVITTLGVAGATFSWNVAGWVLLIAAAVATAFVKLSKLGEIDERKVTFTCLPSQPPRGGGDENIGTDCESCNDKDRYPVCTEYMCESLGSWCKIINPNTEEQKCITEAPSDISHPHIHPLDEVLPSDYGIAPGVDQGFEIVSVKSNGQFYDDNDKYQNGDLKKCIPEFETITFGIHITDASGDAKEAQCKIDDTFVEYSEMSTFFGDSNFRKNIHTMDLLVKDSADGVKDGKIRKYIQCARGPVQGGDYFYSEVPYAIELCVITNDTTAPMIKNTEPPNNRFVKYGAEIDELQVYTNEKANCKWDVIDKVYEDMNDANEVSCDSNVGILGYKCSEKMSLGDLQITNQFYIKCKDKSVNGNAMQESYIHKVKPSASELVISSFEPRIGFIKTVGSLEPTDVTLRAVTIGGAEEGNSVCEWREEAYDYSDYMSYMDYTTDHTYTANFEHGEHFIRFNCSDIAGNSAVELTNFTVKIDDIDPEIESMLWSSGKLKIKTTEKATCKYSFDGYLDFENEEIISMNTVLGFEHTADWLLGKTYYITCKDEYSNSANTEIVVYEI